MRLRHLAASALLTLVAPVLAVAPAAGRGAPPAAPDGRGDEPTVVPGPRPQVAAVDGPALVDAAYRGLLAREPDPGGRAHWEAAAAADPRQVLAALAGTDEHRRVLVTEAYRSVLRRDPDPAGLGWLTGVLAAGRGPLVAEALLYGSAEYLAGPGGGTGRGFVEALYRDVLGRGAEPAGLEHFAGLVQAGLPRVLVAHLVLTSPEAAGRRGLTATSPVAGTVTRSLDAVTVTLDRAVVAEASTVLVTVDGTPLPGTVGQGDFPDTLVFVPDTAPAGAPQAIAVPLEVTVLAWDGASVTRSDVQMAYERPVESLRPGDAGPAVATLQRRLEALGYWIGPIDSRYGLLTQQAVMAFQKTWGLERTGVADRGTMAAMAFAPRPTPRSTTGTVLEVDKARQLLLLARDGRTVWVWNTSTGTEQPYSYGGRTYLADTPPGRWEVFRQVDGIRDGALGRLYRPKYFHGDGIAVHGSPSVPGHPASHGCVRVTNAAMDHIWGADLLPIGTTVWVY